MALESTDQAVAKAIEKMSEQAPALAEALGVFGENVASVATETWVRQALVQGWAYLGIGAILLVVVGILFSRANRYLKLAASEENKCYRGLPESNAAGCHVLGIVGITVTAFLLGAGIPRLINPLFYAIEHWEYLLRSLAR